MYNRIKKLEDKIEESYIRMKKIRTKKLELQSKKNIARKAGDKKSALFISPEFNPRL